MSEQRRFRMPRRLKRELTLQTSGDAHRDGEIKRIMMSAYQHYADVKSRRSKVVVEQDAQETANTYGHTLEGESTT